VDSLIGNTLSHYRILEEIAAGGMGEVYRAVDLNLQRHVAIKLLRNDLPADPVSRQRFLREAQAASTLHHPGVVTVFSVGESDGTPFIVMELVEGESLLSLIGRAPLSLGRVLEIGAQVAEALADAHAAHLIHRDIKPSNILLSADGSAKVLDFGLAKRYRAPSQDTPDATVTKALTDAGAIVGTAAYMSPEQTRGERLDPRTDIFSLGCVLYEMAAGRRAFHAPSMIALFHEIATSDPVPPSSIRPDLPYDFDLLVARAMEKDRERRFPTANALATALRELFESVTTSVPVARPAGVVATPSNLPVAATSFIGRAREAAELKRLIASNRMVTLTGAGGCGKTRLALRVASDLLRDFPSGVWFVGLAGLSDPALVPRAAAGALGIREEPGRPVLETLIEGLGQRSHLLVLDNCEHLAGACAAFTERVLQGAPGCRILCTSRAVLGAPGETRWNIPTLSTPPRMNLIPADHAAQFEAVRLFVDRASAVQPRFALDDRNAGAVAAICRELDGIPLAIELAAARANVLPVGQILERLKDRFSLLASGPRAALARQRTLRATLDWSYDLLSTEEQTLFGRLSVFAGGLSLEAAESVCLGGCIDATTVLDLLSSLADSSLLASEEGVGGAARYRLLESLRQYGRERLAERGEDELACGRHASHFASLAERAESELEGPEQGLWLDRLEEEHENFRAAIQWTLDTADADLGLRIVCGLWRFWWVHGHLSEGRDRFGAVLAMSEAHADRSLRAKALLGAGRMSYEVADYDASRAFHEEALAIRRLIGDRPGIAMSLVNLGIVAHGQGDHALARTRYLESLALQEELGNRRGVAICLNNLGRLANELGELDDGAAHFARSLEIRRSLDDRRGMSISLEGLGDAYFQRGDYAASQEFYARSLEIQRALGDRQGTAESLLRLSIMAAEEGRCDEARGMIREALDTLIEINDRLRLADALDACVPLAWAESDGERSLRLASAGRGFRESAGLPRSPAEERRIRKLVDHIEQALGSGGRRASESGRRLTFEEAIAETQAWLDSAPATEAGT
jgi:non-specific serine/threonine protein kinase